MAVGFPVHHVVVCQRLLLCFLKHVLWQLWGLTWGKIAMEGLWPSRLCMHVFPHGIVDNGSEVLVEFCHLSDITDGFVWEAGGAWLGAVPSGKGLISLRKAAGGPFWDIQAWCGEETLGKGRASREAGWADQTMSSLRILFNCGQSPEVECG